MRKSLCSIVCLPPAFSIPTTLPVQRTLPLPEREPLLYVSCTCNRTQSTTSATQTIALPFRSNTRNAPVPMATRLPSASRTFASAVAVRRVRWATSLSQVMRPLVDRP